MAVAPWAVSITPWGVNQPGLNDVHTTHTQQRAKQLSPTDSQALLVLHITPTKLVLKIQSGQHVEMKELLTDNTALI